MTTMHPLAPQIRDHDQPRSTGEGHRAAFTAWGIGGVVLLFGEAIARLGTRAYATLVNQHDAGTLITAAVVTVTLCYVEGYRGLQRRFAPRAAERALRGAPPGASRARIAVAPLYVLGLVGDDGPNLYRAWAGVGLICAAVLIVRALPPVWRGIIDGGVSAALLWGLIAILSTVARVARNDTRKDEGGQSHGD